MSWTANSSKQRSSISDAISAATAGIGSPLFVFAVLQRASEDSDAVVHLAHELVEMNATLPLGRTHAEKEVHQQRLAAADSAPDVKAARWRLCFRRATEPAERLIFRDVGAALEGVASDCREHRRAHAGSRPGRSRPTAPSPHSGALRCHACALSDFEMDGTAGCGVVRTTGVAPVRQRETVMGPPPSV